MSLWHSPQRVLSSHCTSCCVLLLVNLAFLAKIGVVATVKGTGSCWRPPSSASFRLIPSHAACCCWSVLPAWDRSAQRQPPSGHEAVGGYQAVRHFVNGASKVSQVPSSVSRRIYSRQEAGGGFPAVRHSISINLMLDAAVAASTSAGEDRHGGSIQGDGAREGRDASEGGGGQKAANRSGDRASDEVPQGARPQQRCQVKCHASFLTILHPECQFAEYQVLVVVQLIGSCIKCANFRF